MVCFTQVTPAFIGRCADVRRSLEVGECPPISTDLIASVATLKPPPGARCPLMSAICIWIAKPPRFASERSQGSYMMPIPPGNKDSELWASAGHLGEIARDRPDTSPAAEKADARSRSRRRRFAWPKSPFLLTLDLVPLAPLRALTNESSSPAQRVIVPTGRNHH